VESRLRESTPSRKMRLRERESIKEYKWKLEDDDDNLNDDLLAPKYTSF